MKHSGIGQAARHRTLLPLSVAEALELRCRLAQALHDVGFSFYAIRQVLKCEGPEEARRLCARGRRIERSEFKRV